MTPMNIAARSALTLGALGALYWLYGLARAFLVPYEAAAALKQVHANNEQGAAVSVFLHYNIPLVAAIGLAGVALFIIWFWPRQNGDPST